MTFEVTFRRVKKLDFPQSERWLVPNEAGIKVKRKKCLLKLFFIFSEIDFYWNRSMTCGTKVCNMWSVVVFSLCESDIATPPLGSGAATLLQPIRTSSSVTPRVCVYLSASSNELLTQQGVKSLTVTNCQQFLPCHKLCSATLLGYFIGTQELQGVTLILKWQLGSQGRI